MGARFTDLAELPPTELESLLQAGQPTHLDRLAGFMFHGWSLAMPAPLFSLFGRFGKTFHRDPATGRVRGWNVRMRQNVEAWTPALFRGRPITYGHYEVIGDPEGALAGTYPNAVLIDYGRGGNRAWDPLARVRDWVVAVDDDLLLGRMYLSLGGRQVATPSYFGLARGERLTEVIEPPVRPAAPGTGR